LRDEMAAACRRLAATAALNRLNCLG